MRTEERVTTELVREFVMAAHGDLEKYKNCWLNRQVYFMLLTIGVDQLGKCVRSSGTCRA